MTLGERIKEKRLQAKLTQEELAKKLNTTKQTIGKYENGIVTNLPLNRISELSEALKTTPAYLMGWDEEKPTVTDGGQNINIIRVLGRDGSVVEKRLTDAQLEAWKAVIEQLPDADDL